MLKCNCNEKCYYINKICEEDGMKVYKHLNRCARTNESVKKKKCNFNSQIIYKKEEIEEIIQRLKFDNGGKMKKKYLYKKDIYLLINKDIIDISLLNYYLARFGYESYYSEKESLSELKYRLDNQIKKVINLYVYKNINIEELRCVGEQPLVINKTGSNYFDWTKNDDYIRSLLTISTTESTKNSTKKSTIKSTKKSTKIYPKIYIKPISILLKNELEENLTKIPLEQKIKKCDKIDINSDDDDDENIENIEGFDVEEEEEEDEEEEDEEDDCGEFSD